MQCTTTQRSIAAIVLMFLPILAFAQGLSWETSTLIPMMQGEKIDAKSSYLPRMFKNGDDKEAVVLRLDKQMIYVIDYAGKEYSETSFADFDKYVKKQNAETEAQLADLRKQLASMPEDQRKMMEQMMGSTLDASDPKAKFDVTKTSESKTISGFPCQKYVIKRGGEETATIWTTTAVPDFAAMQKDLKEFNRRMASQMTILGSQMAEAMEKVDGFPILTTVSGMTATVSKVTKAALSKSEFEVPAGFKQVPFEGMKGGDRRGTDDLMEGGMDQDGDEGAEDDEAADDSSDGGI